MRLFAVLRLLHPPFFQVKTHGSEEQLRTLRLPMEILLWKRRRGPLPAASTLCVNQLVVYDFCRLCSDVVHPLYLQHLILRFALFGDTISDGHLIYQLKKHGFCLLVQVCQISVQLAGGCISRYRYLWCCRIYRRCRCPQMPMGRFSRHMRTFSLCNPPNVIDSCNSIILADYKSPKGLPHSETAPWRMDMSLTEIAGVSGARVACPYRRVVGSV